MAAPHAAAEINVVACESCRTKKCRCDRRLPLCSQCIAGGIPCNYPESNKRGFPPGYIAALERRLLETEIALFDALKELQLVQTTSHEDPSSDDGFTARDQPISLAIGKALTKHSANQSKSDKIAEWEVLPLSSRDQQLEWWRERLSLAGSAGDALTQRLSNVRSPRGMMFAGGSSSRQTSFVPSDLAHHSQGGASYISPNGSNDSAFTPESNTMMMMPPPPRPTTVAWSSSHSLDSGGYPNLQLSPQPQQSSPGETSAGQISAQYSWTESTPQDQSGTNVTVPVSQSGGSEPATATYSSGSTSNAQRLSSTQWRRYF